MSTRFIGLLVFLCAVQWASATVVGINCADPSLVPQMKTMAGKIYWRGLGVMPDVEMARACFEQAAFQDPEALYELVNMHAHGNITGTEDLLRISEQLHVDVAPGSNETVLMLGLLSKSHDLGCQQAYYLHQRLKYGPVQRK